MVKDATFISVRDGGFELLSSCKVNTETREVFNENLLKTLQEVNPDLIVLAGYLVVIPERDRCI